MCQIRSDNVDPNPNPLIAIIITLLTLISPVMDNIRLNMELQTSNACVQLESPPLAPNAEISRIKQEKKQRGHIQTGDVYCRQSVRNYHKVMRPVCKGEPTRSRYCRNQIVESSSCPKQSQDMLGTGL